MQVIERRSDFRFPGIYAIKNLLNNKLYVGSSDNVCERLRIHLRDLNANKHHSIHLQRSWRKYGKDSFQFSLIEKVENVSDLLFREQYWMDHFSSYKKKLGYNISPTAGSCRGIKLSEKHKLKLSLAHKGKTISDETRKKISEILKIRCYWIGKLHSQSTKDKISKTKTGSKQTRATSVKRNNSIRKGGSRVGSSKYKGVTWDKEKKKWTAQLRLNRKNIFLGRFDDEVEAAKNYDFHVLSLHLDGAYLNFSEDDYSRFNPKKTLRKDLVESNSMI